MSRRVGSNSVQWMCLIGPLGIGERYAARVFHKMGDGARALGGYSVFWFCLFHWVGIESRRGFNLSEDAPKFFKKSGSQLGVSALYAPPVVYAAPPGGGML